MDEVFGDEGSSSVADMQRLAAIHQRLGLSSIGVEKSDSRGSEEKDIAVRDDHYLPKLA